MVNLEGCGFACHSNFSTYLGALHRADHAVGHLWNHIQSIPEMAGNTTLILTPECGRNLATQQHPGPKRLARLRPQRREQPAASSR